MKRLGKEQLIKLQEKYCSDAAIAKLYGVTRQMIYKLRKKYEIPACKNRNAERDAKIRKLYDTGLSAEMLAVRFKLTATQIYTIVRKREKKKALYTDVFDLKRFLVSEKREKLALLPFTENALTVEQLNHIVTRSNTNTLIGVVSGSDETAKKRIRFLQEIRSVKYILQVEVVQNYSYVPVLDPEMVLFLNNKESAKLDWDGKIEIFH